MLKRFALQQLANWSQKTNRKPLVLSGARQVGKTWLIKEFGKTHYPQTAYVNFDNNARMRQLFAGDYEVSRLIAGLQAETGLTISPQDTLIVFDEVQTNPSALTSLKYFCEDAPQFAVVAAGSLLGLAIQEGTGFPVGKVDSMTLYPMSYPEFLEAVGEGQLGALLTSRDWPLVKAMKDKFIDALRNYYFVGGMPEVVETFRRNRSYAEVRDVQANLLSDYARDFAKHAPRAVVPRIRLLWDSIPAQLAKENKRFVYGDVAKGARSRDFAAAMGWLQGAGLVYQVHRVTKPGVPLAAYADEAFKLYGVDVGLLAAQSGLGARALLEGNRVFTEYKGALTEQYVQQEMRVSCGVAPFYWSAKNAKAEVDFLYPSDEDIIPVEVKAEENLKAKSLRSYVERFAPKRCVRTSMSDYQAESWLVNLPLYAVSQL
jgi:predicted AAA+ superfamily ATPase